VRILVVTGSSGGHIFPALSFLDALKNRGKDVEALLVLPKKGIKIQVKNISFKTNYISISSIKPGFNLRSFSAILRFLKGACESILLLFKFKPDVVVGFGSLVSIPLVFFARTLNIKTLIHEQNVIPGRANRFLAGFANKIAVSFNETRVYFEKNRAKILLTGNPIRKEMVRIDKGRALDFFGLRNERFTILVMGGSQASHRINLGFLKAISKIPDKPRLQVIHLTGAKDYDLLNKNYKDLNIEFRLFDFLEAMQYAYSASDLVISRAGATTITEIIFFGLPAIIIPYPFAYKHQAANAEVLRRLGSGIIIQDEELDSDILGKNIEELINNTEKINVMRSSYGNSSWVNTNDLLVSVVLSLN